MTITKPSDFVKSFLTFTMVKGDNTSHITRHLLNIVEVLADIGGYVEIIIILIQFAI